MKLFVLVFWKILLVAWQGWYWIYRLLWVVYSFSLYRFFWSMNMVYFSIYLCFLWFLSSVFYSFLNIYFLFLSVQFSSVAQPCPTLCDPMNCSTPGLPVHHQLPEFTQTHVPQVSDAIQPFHPLSSPSLPAPNPSQHQGLFQWVNSLHEVAKVLEFQLQHQSF